MGLCSSQYLFGDGDWRRSDEITGQIDLFSRRKAYFPPELSEPYNLLSYHAILMQTIKKELNQHDPLLYRDLRIEHIGSAYECVHIPGALELDLLMVIPAEFISKFPIQGRPNFVYLRPHINSYGNCMQKHIEDFRVDSSHPDGILKSYICAEKFVDKFYEDICSLIRGVTGRDFNVNFTVGKNGTAAIKLEVFRSKKFLYSVDLVPCCEFESKGRQKERYVAKPKDDVTILWRRTFSVEEKAKFLAMDDEVTCEKECLRILKAMCRSNKNLQALTSYHLKTVLLHTTTLIDCDWSNKNRSYCVFELLGQLLDFVKRANLPNFFIKEVNQLRGLSMNTRQDVCDEIERLIYTKLHFQNAIKCT